MYIDSTGINSLVGYMLVHASEPQLLELCDGKLFSFPSKQNVYTVEHRRMEVWPQCSEIIIQRKTSNTVLRFVIFTAPLDVGRRWEQRKESWSKVFDCWISATWCCAPPVNTQRPFLISASIELQNKFMQKSFSYFLSWGIHATCDLFQDYSLTGEEEK